MWKLNLQLFSFGRMKYYLNKILCNHSFSWTWERTLNHLVFNNSGFLKLQFHICFTVNYNAQKWDIRMFTLCLLFFSLWLIWIMLWRIWNLTQGFSDIPRQNNDWSKMFKVQVRHYRFIFTWSGPGKTNSFQGASRL